MRFFETRGRFGKFMHLSIGVFKTILTVKSDLEKNIIICMYVGSLEVELT